eukprot:SM000186S04132  [mRNA]  locus=s186:266417:266996:+ [translate_table: standard]
MLGVVAGLLRGRRVSPKGLTALTSKRAGKGFYKGKRCLPTGRHTPRGGYLLVKEKLPVYIVPDLAGCELKAYVAHGISKKTTSQTASA